MTDLKKLQADYKQAEAKAQKLMADKDTAIQKTRERYGDKLRAANQDAADKQKAWLDAEAAQALVGRDDAEPIAEALGLTLPE